MEIQGGLARLSHPGLHCSQKIIGNRVADAPVLQMGHVPADDQTSDVRFMSFTKQLERDIACCADAPDRRPIEADRAIALPSELQIRKLNPRRDSERGHLLSQGRLHS